MTRFKLLKWRDLPRPERGAWTAFRAADPTLRSPYFDPAFLDVLDRVRPDLEVMAVETGGAPVGFLPLHRSSLGGAAPAAGPLSDWHGFVAEPGFRPPLDEGLRAVGLARFRFDSALPALAGEGATIRGAYALDLRQGFDAYRDRRRAGAGKAWRSLASRERRLGETVRVVADDRSPETLRTLLAWKSAQYRRSGQFDLFTRDWIVRLVEALAGTQEGGFRGRVSSLWIGDRLAAAHFGMQSGGVLHYWFPAYDAAMAEHAPGLLLLTGLARQADAEGITEIDLGKGDYRFKREFADPGQPAAEGVVFAANARGRFGRVSQGLARQWGELPLGPVSRLPGKLARRIRRDLSYLTPDYAR